MARRKKKEGQAMDRKSATELIKANWKKYYPADRSKGIVCPICGSGSGKNGTGITEKPNSRHFLKCWNGGCSFNQGGSVIDLYMLEHGMRQEEFSRAVDEMAAQINIKIDSYTGNRSAAADGKGAISFSGTEAPAADQTGAAAAAGGADQEPTPEKEPQANYKDYYIHCLANLEESETARRYLQARGISIENAKRYFIGFDPEWISPTVVKKQIEKGSAWIPEPKPCIILPSTYSHYVARDIRPKEQLSEKDRRYQNEGEPWIFGGYRAFHSAAEYIFVTEGAFDALSVIEAGQAAIGLNSTSNAEKLIKQLEAEPTKATLVLCLDNDESGKRTTEKLKEGLQRLNVSYIIADICNGKKDPNEALTADKEAFTAAISRAITKKPDNSSLYIDSIMGDEISRRRAEGKKKTGFANLDAETGGGLRPGLVLFGAISSLGKTTFCSQLADGFAENGSDVIYFSLEQSRLEMVSKSIARQTAKIDIQRAVTGAQIADGAIPADRQSIAAQAAEQYKKAVGDRVSIIEAGFNCDTQFLAEYVRGYYTRTGKRPVVIVDYLQVLEPGETQKGRRMDNREKVEESIKQLIMLKRELDLTIIAIVSLNRTNYLQPFDFEAIKETGLAEYSGDVVWGLQLACLDEPLFAKEGQLKEKREKVKAAKKAIPRKVKLCSVKHRLQNPIYECYFDYYPQYDLFVPAQDPGYTEAAGQRYRKI